MSLSLNEISNKQHFELFFVHSYQDKYQIIMLNVLLISKAHAIMMHHCTELMGVDKQPL